MTAEPTTTEVAVRRPATDDWVPVMRPVVALAEHVADTEFVPKAFRGNAPAIAAAILHGRELGLGPMTALAQTNVIDGRPAISAEQQRALVLAAGHEIEFAELSDAVVTVRGRRAGAERWTTVTWTLDRARHAGLTGKKNWQNYPRAMLAARASAELCRLQFPDVLHGMAATEELEESAPATDGQQTATGGRTRAVRRQAADPGPEAPLPAPDAPEAAPEAEQWHGRAVEDVPLPEPEPEPEVAAPRASVTPAQLRMLGVMWRKVGIADDDERRALTAELVGRALGGTTKNLTMEEASRIIDLLVEASESGNDPREALAWLTRYLTEGEVE